MRKYKIIINYLYKIKKISSKFYFNSKKNYYYMYMYI